MATARGPAAPLPARASRGGGRVLAAVLATAVVSAAVTAVVALVPSLRLAYRSPDLHVALLTAEALVALLSAFLMWGRLVRRRRLDDLLLCAAFAVLAVSNLFFAAVPAVVASDSSVFATWSAMAGRLLGGVLLAAAALVPARRLRRSPRALLAVVAGVAAVMGLIGLAVGMLEPHLPSGVDVLPAESSSRPRLEAVPAVVAAHAAGFGVLAIAAGAFAVRAERTADPLLRRLAVAAVLSAAARVNAVLYPSTFTEYVATADAFRLGFYVVVASAALAEIRSYWRGLAEAAALTERRRVARELHDGLAQELAAIRRNLHWLDEGDPAVARVRASAERAIAESRRAVAALADGHAGPLDAALAQAAERIADREGAQVVVSVDPDVRLRPAQRDAVVMIAGEAIVNAARHASAEVVRVELAGGRRPRLRIEDAGRGFDVAAPVPPGHFGLRAMHERAEAVGADLRLRSRPGAGTRVEVLL